MTDKRIADVKTPFSFAPSRSERIEFAPGQIPELVKRDPEILMREGPKGKPVRFAVIY